MIAEMIVDLEMTIPIVWVKGKEYLLGA